MSSISIEQIFILVTYIYLSYIFGKGLSSIITYTLHSYVKNIPEEVNCKFITISIVSGLYLIPLLMELWVMVNHR